jgi:hypothetical protein
MAAPTREEFQAAFEEARSWPAQDRLSLVQMLLATLGADLKPREFVPRSAEEISAGAAGKGPPPDDETVKQWIQEHRLEKYGR